MSRHLFLSTIVLGEMGEEGVTGAPLLPPLLTEVESVEDTSDALDAPPSTPSVGAGLVAAALPLTFCGQGKWASKSNSLSIKLGFGRVEKMNCPYLEDNKETGMSKHGAIRYLITFTTILDTQLKLIVSDNGKGNLGENDRWRSVQSESKLTRVYNRQDGTTPPTIGQTNLT